MGIPHILLEAGGIYHIYNHAVGNEKLFREDANYHFFLKKFENRLFPVADFLAYCLMPNHFHFVMRFHEKKELLKHYHEKVDKVRKGLEKRNRDSSDHDLIDALLISDFGALFNSYAQAYNRRFCRWGSLLKESFQRKGPVDNTGLLRLICYVHNNPVHHGYVQKREDWKYSSLNSLLSDKNSNLLRNEVLDLFGGMDNFIYLHNKNLGNFDEF